MSKEKKNNPTLKIKINKIFILNDKIKKKIYYIIKNTKIDLSSP
jgi:hypothetical protein